MLSSGAISNSNEALWGPAGWLNPRRAAWDVRGWTGSAAGAGGDALGRAVGRTAAREGDGREGDAIGSDGAGGELLDSPAGAFFWRPRVEWVAFGDTSTGAAADVARPATDGSSEASTPSTLGRPAGTPPRGSSSAGAGC